MKITVVGTGYVGLVTGTCLAEVGNDVLCVDVDAAKIATPNAGGVPIHEPGLDQLISRNATAAAGSPPTPRGGPHGTLQFIAVGTPPGMTGRPICNTCWRRPARSGADDRQDRR